MVGFRRIGVEALDDLCHARVTNDTDKGTVLAKGLDPRSHIEGRSWKWVSRRNLMPLVPNFMPSINGLPFSNSWPPQPDIVVDVPPFGQVAIGDASNGLCGGMVFTVRDVFESGQPPLTDPQPSQ